MREMTFLEKVINYKPEHKEAWAKAISERRDDVRKADADPLPLKEENERRITRHP
jgi:hypothetical protein